MWCVIILSSPLPPAWKSIGQGSRAYTETINRLTTYGYKKVVNGYRIVNLLIRIILEYLHQTEPLNEISENWTLLIYSGQPAKWLLDAARAFWNIIELHFKQPSFIWYHEDSYFSVRFLQVSLYVQSCMLIDWGGFYGTATLYGYYGY